MAKIREPTIAGLHGQLADAAEAWTSPARPSTLHRYCFRHGVAHLLARFESTRAEALLTNFEYAMARLASENGEGARPMARDYIAVQAIGGLADSAEFRIWKSFFRERAHILVRGDERWPAHKNLLQQAMEHADDSPITKKAEIWLATGKCDWLWLRNARRLAEAAPNTCLAVLEGHTDKIGGVLDLRDGRVISWAEDHVLRIWDATAGNCLRVLQGHSLAVIGALVLPDGGILSWSFDHTLRAWDIASGTCRAVLEGHTDQVNGALVLPSGYILSWAGDLHCSEFADRTIRIWDLVTGECRMVLDDCNGHEDGVDGVLDLNDGRVLSWSFDKTLRIWDTTSGECSIVLEGHKDVVCGALVLPNDEIVSWSADKSLRIWDPINGKCRAVLKGHAKQVVSALVLPDGNMLSWSYDETFRVWDANSAKCQLVIEAGHVSGTPLVLPASRILSISSDNTLRVSDIVSGTCLSVLVGHTNIVHGALILPNSLLLSWSADNSLRIWDPQTGACFAILAGHTDTVAGALLLPNGAMSWAHDNTLRLWDTTPWLPLDIIEVARQELPSQSLDIIDDAKRKHLDELLLTASSIVCNEILVERSLEGHAGKVAGVLALPDGDVLSWEWDEAPRVWDIATGACRAVLDGHKACDAMVLPNGEVLSWSSSEHRLEVWDAKLETCRATLNGHSERINGVLALPCGGVLSWSYDKTLRVWDIASEECRAILGGHAGSVDGALILPNGEILSWSSDHTLRIWNAMTGGGRVVLKGHTSHIAGAIALPGGDALSWGDISHTLRIWSTETGTCRAVLKGHTNSVNGALALPNGRILSWSCDGTLRVWDVTKQTRPTVLRGHAKSVGGALFLPDGCVLSWDQYNQLSRSHNSTFRVWNGVDWKCRAVITATDASFERPDLVAARFLTRSKLSTSATNRWAVGEIRNCLVLTSIATARCVEWQADCECKGQSLFPDGTVVVTLDDGHVFFLKLFQGNQRISSAEAAESFDVAGHAHHLQGVK